MSIPTPTPNPSPAHVAEFAKPSKRRRWKTPLVAVTAGVVGVALGAAAPSGAEADTEPEVVTETVTETVTEEVVVTEEVEVEVEVTPAACHEALAAAEEAFDIYSAGLLTAADAMDAAVAFDVAGIDAATANLQDLNPQLDAALIAYFTHADGC